MNMLLEFLIKSAIVLVIFAAAAVIATLISTRLPERFYYFRNWIFRERGWEKHGEFYQRVFRVKRWKDRLPEISDFIKSTFPKKSVKEFSSEYVEKFLLESCRAEFAHWCIIFSTLIFLFFGGLESFASMLAVSVLLNTPFIIIQRYNRPRIILIMKQKGIDV